jgi:hypothetical protein
MPELGRHLWQLKTIVFLHWCLIHAVLLALFDIWEKWTTSKRFSKNKHSNLFFLIVIGKISFIALSSKLFFFVTDALQVSSSVCYLQAFSAKSWNSKKSNTLAYLSGVFTSRAGLCSLVHYWTKMN